MTDLVIPIRIQRNYKRIVSFGFFFFLQFHLSPLFPSVGKFWKSVIFLFNHVFREVVDEIHARSSQDLSFGKNAAKAFRYVALINQSTRLLGTLDDHTKISNRKFQILVKI